MIPRSLLQLLDAPFTFVVGKGGVGKSTAAAAIALAMAERGEPVRLISTDPAHSVGDLFRIALRRGEPSPSPCTPDLTLEELDSRSGMERWLARIGDPISQLMEEGSYLDREDIHAFLNLALPGADELVAALRLAELAAAGEGRVVVDTAPTGHTLRLLASDRLIEGWVLALGAMADRAGAVRERLTRRRIRLAGEGVIDELQGVADHLRRDLLPHARFLVVSRAGKVVRAETERLSAHLIGLGLHIAAELRVGGDESPDLVEQLHRTVPVVSIPWEQDLEGCEGLRRWGEGATVHPGRAASAPDRDSREWNSTSSMQPVAKGAGTPQEGSGPAILGLLRCELLFFTGKGGVGKSTAAAAFALALAREEPVLLIGLDPAGSLEDILPGVDPDHAVTVLQVDAEREFEAFRVAYRAEIEEGLRRIGLDSGGELDRRVLEGLVDLAPPGIDEIFAIGTLLREGRAGVRLVVDTAPTGHFLRLLEAPEVALEWTHAVLRFLFKYRSLVGLDTFAKDLLELARSLRSLLELLGDSARSGVVVVTLDHPVVEAETARLIEALGESGVAMRALLRNRVVPGRSMTTTGSSSLSKGPVIEAPLFPPSLVGPEELLNFFSSWTLSQRPLPLPTSPPTDIRRTGESESWS